MFLLDTRVGESHTRVAPERGFGGKCIPKDLQTIVAWARQSGAPATLVEAIAYNKTDSGPSNIAVHHIRLQPTTDDRFAQNRPSRGGTA